MKDSRRTGSIVFYCDKTYLMINITKEENYINDVTIRIQLNAITEF